MNEENEEPEFWELELDERNKSDLQDWVDNDDLVGLVEEESGGVIGYINRYHIDKVLTILNLWWNKTKPAIGYKMYVGGLGDAIVTDNSNPDEIEVYLVTEEDGTVSWQLIPDEHSDIVLKSIKVTPVEPVG